MATLARVAGLDEVLVTAFVSPASFTGEDVVEISAHGSPAILDEIVARAIQGGARHAKPGEFSLRAVLNGRMDLVQAEAVSDLIQSDSRRQAAVAFDQLDGLLTGRIQAIERALFELRALLEASLDFPDEGYRFIEGEVAQSRIELLVAEIEELLGVGKVGRVIRDGARVLLVGRRNAGKSSLFNRLVGFDRAIVSEVAGTTRDLVTESVVMAGLTVRLVDAAGLGETQDSIEAEGMSRTMGAMGVADLVLVVIDGSCELLEPDTVAGSLDVGRRLVVLNKVDVDAERVGVAQGRGWIPVSAVSGLGLEALRDAVVAKLSGGEAASECPAISNERHLRHLEVARSALLRGRSLCAEGVPEEFVLGELADAAAELQQITGVRASEEVLEEVFARFCIGK